MSISRTSAPMWRQARTLSILFWTGFGFAPLAALLLLVGDSGFTIKVALILGLGSVVLIGLSVVLRSDPGTVERDLYAALADSEAETKRALAELRGDMRRKAIGHEPAPQAVAAATAPPPRELPYERHSEQYDSRQAEEPRRSRQGQGSGDYYQRQSAHRSDERESGYVAETTAVPRQRWEDDYPSFSYDNEQPERQGGRRGQAVEAWRDDAAGSDTRSRRSRGVENGWADEVYNSGSQPRASHSSGGTDPGGRGRHYREPDELDGVIPSRHYRDDDDPSGEISSRSSRRREYAEESRSQGGGSYMDTYYGDSRR